MRHVMIIRESNGRIVGKLDDYWLNSDEDESYFDYREPELIFPRHDHGKSSPVTVWNLNDVK